MGDQQETPSHEPNEGETTEPVQGEEQERPQKVHNAEPKKLSISAEAAVRSMKRNMMGHIDEEL
jgi:hypothetical protein